MTDFKAEIELEGALARAALDITKLPEFYRSLLDSFLYVIDESSEPIDGHSPEENTLQVRTLEIEGEHYIPVFTSVAQIREFTREEVGYVRMPAEELLPVLQESLIALNPAFEYGKILTPGETQAILDGSIFELPASYEMEAGSQIEIFEAPYHPAHIMDALSEYFRAAGTVRAAYLAHYRNADEGEEPHIIIGIDVESGWEQTISDVCRILESICHTDELVDVIQINGSDISEYLVQETTPFWVAQA